MTLFGELADVFPDRFVHFGGDEVHLPDGAETDGLQAAFNRPPASSAGCANSASLRLPGTKRSTPGCPARS